MTKTASDPSIPQSNYWLDLQARDALNRFGTNEILVSTGHSPSGAYHVGHLREFITASALVWAIKQRGGQAKHIDFVDDFDAFRKVPVDVPSSFSEFLGRPLYLVPDPHDCHGSYADHYYTGLDLALQQIGVVRETVHARHSYPQGRYASAIETTLMRLPEARAAIQDVGKRELPEDWAPVQILDDDNRLTNWKFDGWNQERQTVQWKAADGSQGAVSYAKGRVKLDWRLDWPARWHLWGIGIEPFGRDHASKGGSYETGKELVRSVFNGEAPIPVPYDFINLIGDTKKMSASKGTGLSMGDALELLPAEILRYFVVRSRPSKLLSFDPGLGLYNLIDEYATTDAAVRADEPAEFGDAYRFAADLQGDAAKTAVVSRVPFAHLVSVYQAAQLQPKATMDILARTGYTQAVQDEASLILRELRFVHIWLLRHAPESVKFQVQTKMPAVELSIEQTQFLRDVSARLANQAEQVDGQAMHDMIYAAREAVGLKPGEAFKALYRVILNRDSGPKAGWFLASLDQQWLVERLALKA